MISVYIVLPRSIFSVIVILNNAQFAKKAENKIIQGQACDTITKPRLSYEPPCYHTFPAEKLHIYDDTI